MRGRRWTWEDGLPDLFVGAGLVLIGVAWLIPPVSRLGGLAPLLLLPLWPLARAALARRGGGPSARVPPSPASVARRVLVSGALALALGAGMVRVAQRSSGVPDDWVGTVIPAFLGVLIGIGAVAMGLLIGLSRLLAYGVAIALLSAALTAAGVHAGVFLVIAGGGVLISGITILVRHLMRTGRPPG